MFRPATKIKAWYFRYSQIALIFFGTAFLIGAESLPEGQRGSDQKGVSGVKLWVLGTVQDAGSPQLGCQKDCCTALSAADKALRKIVSLGLTDATSGEKYLFEATPDISSQLDYLYKLSGQKGSVIPDGVFVTHAHIGHYTGLMYFGKEAANTRDLPLYAMPKMADYLRTNGPWSQLVTNRNIKLIPLESGLETHLGSRLRITPILVPHRDEYSETVGFYIQGPLKSALFIPDIDKWERWEEDIEVWIKRVDFAFLDATFFSQAEIAHRNIEEIPHPLVVESIGRFENLAVEERSKVVFIHLNHTNPLLNRESTAYKSVIQAGFKVAEIGDGFDL